MTDKHWYTSIQCPTVLNFEAVLSAPVANDGEESQPLLLDTVWESDDETRGFFETMATGSEQHHPSRVQKIDPPSYEIRKSGPPRYTNRPSIPFEEYLRTFKTSEVIQPQPAAPADVTEFPGPSSSTERKDEDGVGTPPKASIIPKRSRLSRRRKALSTYNSLMRPPVRTFGTLTAGSATLDRSTKSTESTASPADRVPSVSPDKSPSQVQISPPIKSTSPPAHMDAAEEYSEKASSLGSLTGLVGKPGIVSREPKRFENGKGTAVLRRRAEEQVQPQLHQSPTEQQNSQLPQKEQQKEQQTQSKLQTQKQEVIQQPRTRYPPRRKSMAKRPQRQSPLSQQQSEAKQLPKPPEKKPVIPKTKAKVSAPDVKPEVPQKRQLSLRRAKSFCGAVGQASIQKAQPTEDQEPRPARKMAPRAKSVRVGNIPQLKTAQVANDNVGKSKANASNGASGAETSLSALLEEGNSRVLQERSRQRIQRQKTFELQKAEVIKTFAEQAESKPKETAVASASTTDSTKVKSSLAELTKPKASVAVQANGKRPMPGQKKGKTRATSSKHVQQDGTGSVGITKQRKENSLVANRRGLAGLRGRRRQLERKSNARPVNNKNSQSAVAKAVKPKTEGQEQDAQDLQSLLSQHNQRVVGRRHFRVVTKA